MTVFTNETREAWQKIANDAYANRPSVGKRVKITGGKKHLGKEGKVIWHGVNKFYSTQYKSDAQLALMEINGREGFSVRVQPDEGEAFFVPAEYTAVIITAEPVEDFNPYKLTDLESEAIIDPHILIKTNPEVVESLIRRGWLTREDNGSIFMSKSAAEAFDRDSDLAVLWLVGQEQPFGDEVGADDFDADCPICLRHQPHTLAQHEAALRRSYGHGDDPGDPNDVL